VYPVYLLAPELVFLAAAGFVFVGYFVFFAYLTIKGR
jgi:hypothetical protein